jgi:phosphatidylserine/phosphatidylglycerophosphate/cardiolipin synthase-like enzyme
VDTFLEANVTKVTNPKENTQLNPEGVGQINQESITKKDSDLVQWITQWRAIQNLNFPMESKHFFLEGSALDELARGLIGKAQDQILVTNPYVDSCHLTTALERAMEKKIKIKVVTRRPVEAIKDASKIECQASLRKSGMLIHYDNQIHAKIIVIDKEVAIVSSMNLYSGSSGGATKEAGIVSIDKKVVESTANYILDLLDKPESTERRY